MTFKPYTYLDYLKTMMHDVEFNLGRFTLMDLMTLSRIPVEEVISDGKNRSAFDRVQAKIQSELDHREQRATHDQPADVSLLTESQLLAEVTRLTEENTRLRAREQRFIRHCDSLNTALGIIANTDGCASALLNAVTETGLDVSYFILPADDWYHANPETVIRDAFEGKCGEAHAAYVLDVDRLQAREMIRQLSAQETRK